MGVSESSGTLNASRELPSASPKRKDSPMAVEVYRTYQVNPVETHKEGEVVEVNEGHLHVRKKPISSTPGARGKTIAVYAPGSWHDAKVVAADGSD